MFNDECKFNIFGFDDNGKICRSENEEAGIHTISYSCDISVREQLNVKFLETWYNRSQNLPISPSRKKKNL